MDHRNRWTHAHIALHHWSRINHRRNLHQPLTTGPTKPETQQPIPITTTRNATAPRELHPRSSKQNKENQPTATNQSQPTTNPAQPQPKQLLVYTQQIK